MSRDRSRGGQVVNATNESSAWMHVHTSRRDSGLSGPTLGPPMAARSVQDRPVAAPIEIPSSSEPNSLATEDGSHEDRFLRCSRTPTHRSNIAIESFLTTRSRSPLERSGPTTCAAGPRRLHRPQARTDGDLRRRHAKGYRLVVSWRSGRRERRASGRAGVEGGGLCLRPPFDRSASARPSFCLGADRDGRGDRWLSLQRRARMARVGRSLAAASAREALARLTFPQAPRGEGRGRDDCDDVQEHGRRRLPFPPDFRRPWSTPFRS